MYYYEVDDMKGSPVQSVLFTSEEETLERMLHAFKHDLAEKEIFIGNVYGEIDGNTATIYGMDDDGVYIVTKYSIKEA